MSLLLLLLLLLRMSSPSATPLPTTYKHLSVRSTFFLSILLLRLLYPLYGSLLHYLLLKLTAFALMHACMHACMHVTRGLHACMHAPYMLLANMHVCMHVCMHARALDSG